MSSPNNDIPVSTLEQFINDLPRVDAWSIKGLKEKYLHCWYKNTGMPASTTWACARWPLTLLAELRPTLPAALQHIREFTGDAVSFNTSRPEFLQSQVRHYTQPLVLPLERDAASNYLLDCRCSDAEEEQSTIYAYCCINRINKFLWGEPADLALVIATAYRTRHEQSDVSCEGIVFVDYTPWQPVTLTVPVPWLDQRYPGWRDRYLLASSLDCESQLMEQLLFYPETASTHNPNPLLPTVLLD